MNVRTIVGWVVMCGVVSLIAPLARANSIEVENVGLQEFEVGEKTVAVTFDLSWANSWRSAENWDAAWVFVKFRAPGSSIWQHAALSTIPSDHKPAGNSTIDAVPDGKGVFVYRSGGYTGNVSYANTRVKWTYESNGCAFAKGDAIEVSVHAIEMVYIPQGAFYLGSGAIEDYNFHRYSDGSQSTNPYLVDSEAAITVGTADGNLYYAAGGGDQIGTISNAFPKGYNAFYCMKYEISQGQYADFLNKLTETQDGNRFPNRVDKRHTITGTTSNRSAGAPDRGCNYLAWADVAAYEDWAALRPMTELEFEKACRGFAFPFPGEYAWGTNTLNQLTAESGTPGSGSETPGGASDNCLYGGALDGPTRVGIFARATSDRVKAGAGYFGVMELSGNLWERTVTVGHPTGRAFQGTAGDGLLNDDGTATNPDWPVNSNGNGSGLRGGSWFNIASSESTSDRVGAAAPNAGRDAHFGARGVRQAP